MDIVYRRTKSFLADELSKLFNSVAWSSGNYPDKLIVAMENSDSVFSVWNHDKLVGLVNVLDDGIMTAYVHYLLVNSHYQGCGIGKALMQQVIEKYQNYLRIVLVAYDKEIGFYEKCGFKKGQESSPMFISSLWT